eukprot:TRINITY_DN7579_c0_g3_i1.p2 TRINITY_DN7579_c0_g3~~TRINITY_DN7579_c0_g3_i1.p2  ORF type:complete len:116 (+),score=5.69 TRINITY_DN7579_c0_g3_i1:973-1320(+)
MISPWTTLQLCALVLFALGLVFVSTLYLCGSCQRHFVDDKSAMEEEGGRRSRARSPIRQLLKPEESKRAGIRPFRMFTVKRDLSAGFFDRSPPPEPPLEPPIQSPKADAERGRAW